MDKQRAENAVRELLLALNQDVDSQGLQGTPERVARMFIEQCSSSDSELDAQFVSTFEGMVTVRDIPFQSCCMHHMVFYFGRAHIAYIPKGKDVLGISKLARLVNSCSKGFTIQEDVTQSIAEALYNGVDILGCMVIIEAEHGCMCLRGAKATGSSTVTSVVKGVFRDVTAARAEFQGLIQKGGLR